MKRYRRSHINALIGYLLVAVAILGGVAWATVATLRLAKVDLDHRLQSDHATKLRLALWRMDSLLTPIISFEEGRPYTDYLPIHIPNSLISLDEDEDVPPGLYVSSPLIEGPRRDVPWMDFYFQVQPDGMWTSPELLDPYLSRRIAEDRRASDARTAFLRQELAKLHGVAPVAEITSRTLVAAVAGLQVGDEGLGAADRSALSELESAQMAVGAADSALKVPDLVRRDRGRTFAGSNVLSATCDRTDIMWINLNQWTGLYYNPLGESSAPYAAVEPLPMASMWLKPRQDSHPRLAFVRRINIEDQAYHQGFFVRWDLLRADLLMEIADLFPAADLIPVDSEEQAAQAALDTLLSTIPVRLDVPPPAMATMASAWPTVRGTLIVSWLAALAVLVITGLGIRDLVALTERRMQFAYAVTHELRTPLTTFRLYADMLSAGLVPEDSRQMYLDTLNHEAQRLSKLVEQVLEYARLENQKVRLNPVRADGRALLERCTATLQERCAATHVRGQTMADFSADFQAYTDLDLVNQIAGVLLNNACRHAGRSSDPEVRLEVRGENGTFQLDVIDNGPGVSRDDAREIFKPFRRGRRADQDAQGGIGLGLALARSWARLLGGRLDLVQGRHTELGGAHFRLIAPSVIEQSGIH